MAFFDKTSTAMLSMIGAVYGVFIYSISFSLEMWFIISSPLTTNAHHLSHSSTSFYGHQLPGSSLSAAQLQSQPQSHGESNPSHADHELQPSEVPSLPASGSADQISVPLLAFVLAALYF